MLAIAAPSFNAPSETFIHDHVRYLAPGRTVLVCNDGRGAERFGCPVLSDFDPWTPPVTLPERAVNAVRQRWRRYVRPGLWAADRRRLVAFFKQWGVRVVLAEYGPTGVLVMDACRDAGVPLYVHFHGYDASILLQDRNWLKRYRRLFDAVSCAVVPSCFLMEKLRNQGFPLEKLRLNYCGIDTSRFLPTARESGRIVAVGRLVDKKAPHLTIKAFAEIAGKFPEARLDMVGDGPLAERCRNLVRDLQLEGRVYLHGAQPTEFVGGLLARASLFVQHSVTAENGDTEGLGVSLIEAMASAVPVVATRHNGFVETVEDGTTGLLVDEHDVRGMAEAMLSILQHPARAEAMGDAGRARAIHLFSIERSCRGLRRTLGLEDYSPLPP